MNKEFQAWLDVLNDLVIVGQLLGQILIDFSLPYDQIFLGRLI